MKKLFTLSISIFLLGAAMGCTKNDGSIPDWPWYDPSDPDEWVKVDNLGTLPSHIEVFRSKEGVKMKGQNVKAYIAVIDTKQASFSVCAMNDPELSGAGKIADVMMTPTDVYNNCGEPYIIINGGYFYTSDGTAYAASLAVNNGTFLSPNINYASEDWVSIYYPTRAAFVEHTDGTYEAAWTYWADKDNHFLYQSPAQNSWASSPLEQPSATFPAGGVAFEAKNAIGGGPVLIKGGKIVNTYVAELFNGENSGILVDTRHPRTAIGITADKKLVLFVCEGRQTTEGIDGYTLQEVAQILLSYGCVEAINLDGGGSSCMLVNGYETITPSDTDGDGKHVQRKVGSCVYIK